MQVDCDCGAPLWLSYEETEEHRKAVWTRRGIAPWRTCRCGYKEECHKYNYKRDRKAYSKADKKYKVMHERIRRAKMKDAMSKAWKTEDYEGYNILPIFPRENNWAWE
jgi:hypothetical protein